MIRWFLFIRFADMPDALRLGWLPLPGFGDSRDTHWSVLCTWLCCCDRRPPRPTSIREAAHG